MLETKLYDNKRQLVVPGDSAQTVAFSAVHFVSLATTAIETHGSFFVALSGGNTPRQVYERVTRSPLLEQINWSRVHLFFSDERAVPPTSDESNYKMAMDAGFSKLPIPFSQIHRMQGDALDLAKEAKRYEKEMREVLTGLPLDLVLLGLGDDGHTASLFPGQEALKDLSHWVIPAYAPAKKSWRLTMTYTCINNARNIAIYAFGASKKNIVKDVFTHPDQIEKWPVQGVGTPGHPAIWILDTAAASEL